MGVFWLQNGKVLVDSLDNPKVIEKEDCPCFCWAIAVLCYYDSDGEPCDCRPENLAVMKNWKECGLEYVAYDEEQKYVVGRKYSSSGIDPETGQVDPDDQSGYKYEVYRRFQCQSTAQAHLDSLDDCKKEAIAYRTCGCGCDWDRSVRYKVTVTKIGSYESDSYEIYSDGQESVGQYSEGSMEVSEAVGYIEKCSDFCEISGAQVNAHEAYSYGISYPEGSYSAGDSIFSGKLYIEKNKDCELETTIFLIFNQMCQPIFTYYHDEVVGPVEYCSIDFSYAGVWQDEGYPKLDYLKIDEYGYLNGTCTYSWRQTWDEGQQIYENMYSGSNGFRKLDVTVTFEPIFDDDEFEAPAGYREIYGRLEEDLR